MIFDDKLKAYLLDTASALHGSDKRRFMALTVIQLGRGGQSIAIRELGWARATLRLASHEFRTGIVCMDAFHFRGVRPPEVRFPKLEDDIRDIVDSQSQQDPQFKSLRLYTRLSFIEVRRQLIAQKGYTEEELPKIDSIRSLIKRMGYHAQKVQKALPKKR